MIQPIDHQQTFIEVLLEITLPPLRIIIITLDLKNTIMVIKKLVVLIQILVHLITSQLDGMILMV